ncbi:MAG TPA: MFS transporter, partial [Opitutus sp.]|nr:MFS transporter [Opitutus sp.]
LPKSKFAQYASGLDIIQSLAVMLIGPAMGAVLDWTHHSYRYTFLASFVVAIAAIVAAVVVYRRFMVLGGPQHYVAPE